MQRTENGTVTSSPSQVVAADLIAALSGLSLSNVTRMIAAQHFLIREEIATASEVTDLYAVPIAMPDALRVRRVDDAINHLRSIAHGIPPAIKKLLKHNLWR